MALTISRSGYGGWRDAEPDPARRRAGWRLDVAAGGLRSAAEELLDTADEVIRLAVRTADACPVPWGVCPEHGATLSSSGGVAGAPRPVAFGVGITTDSASRAPNRSPTVSSMPKATISTSATVTHRHPQTLDRRHGRSVVLTDGEAGTRITGSANADTRVSRSRGEAGRRAGAAPRHAASSECAVERSFRPGELSGHTASPHHRKLSQKAASERLGGPATETRCGQSRPR